MEKQEFITELIKYGLPVPGMIPQIKMKNAKDKLTKAFEFYLGLQEIKFVWRNEYQQVADWFQDNESRGLFLYGDCGLGKSMLSRYVIPGLLFSEYGRNIKVVTTHQMNANLDELLTYKMISIDDVGTESIINQFGNKRLAFAEIMDAVERDSKLIIISTNLNGNEIEARYGTRTIERIISTTKRIEFRGKSFRK